MSSDRILSIQSWVAFGYVGGKAAIFPLQCLGYDVDVVNTVNFSNHAGYGHFGGTKTTASELSGIFRGMEDNGLLIPRRLLTGYIPGAEALNAISELVAKLKERNPEIIYLLDPVLGDAGKLYVSPDVIPVYRKILHFATVITPNWFEVETLTDVKLTSMASLQRALQILHSEYHVPNVVISSIPSRQWLLDALPPNLKPNLEVEQQSLFCISSSLESSGNLSRVHIQSVPLIPGYFSGVGDLFSALLLGHYDPKGSEHPLAEAASLALTKTHAILSSTFEHSESLPEDERQYSDEEKDAQDPSRKTKRMRGRELRLVQCQDILRGVGTVDTWTLRPWDEFWS